MAATSYPKLFMNNDSPYVNAAALKLLLPDYLNRIGCRPVFQGHGQVQLLATCPLHSDQHPSLAAKKSGDVWEWFCQPCSVGGTVLELHARRFKLDTQTQFPQICREVAQILQGIPFEIPLTDQSTIQDSIMNTPPMPKEELAALTRHWRNTLYCDTALRSIFASELGLPSCTLQWAANLPSGGLGIAPAGYKLTTSDGRVYALPEPRLVYIGESHFKIRAPFGNGINPRFWMSGQQLRPWLGHLLVPGDSTVKDVHIHESESSALTLIACGAWLQDNSSIVVATSGCGGFKPEWIPLLANRIIHMWPDADEAGKRFADTTATLLYPTASKIVFHDWDATSPMPTIP
jgi:hypothetical protein